MSDEQSHSLDEILKMGVEGGASDIHLKAGLPPLFRVDGSLLPVRDYDRLKPEHTEQMAARVMNDRQRQEFKEKKDLDLSYGIPGVGRFRVNTFLQRGKVGLVFRAIPYEVKPLGELNLPPVIESLAEERRGLILATGATGSGKSTTLAAILDYINRSRTAHIVTIEDPIEYVLRDKRSVVNQREVGDDAKSFKRALRAGLRQDPDVIMLGELRDHETMEIALTAAETGHLVLSTLHTIDAADAVNRMVTAFPPHQRDQARYQFANLFKGIIAQRLVPRADGDGRVPAAEIMVSTARIQDLILEEATSQTITEQIAEGVDSYGMQTFDQSLLQLLEEGLITYEEAIAQATNPDDFKLRVKGVGSTSESADWDQFKSTDSDSGTSGERRANSNPSSVNHNPLDDEGGGGDDDLNLDDLDVEDI